MYLGVLMVQIHYILYFYNIIYKNKNKSKWKKTERYIEM